MYTDQTVYANCILCDGWRLERKKREILFYWRWEQEERTHGGGSSHFELALDIARIFPCWGQRLMRHTADSKCLRRSLAGLADDSWSLPPSKDVMIGVGGIIISNNNLLSGGTR